MAKVISTGGAFQRSKTTRPGVHAKSKTSRLKSSKNYKKLSKGQG